MFADVNWVEVIIGFLLGLLPAGIGFIRNLFKTIFDKSKLLGQYYLYHLSGTEAGLVRKKKLKIYKSIKGYLAVSLEKSEHTGLSFKGRVMESSGALRYLNIKGDNNKERIFIIINVPINDNFDRMSGVMAALNIHGKPLCGRILLSKRDDLPDNEVKAVTGDSNLYAEPLKSVVPAPNKSAIHGT